jgi:hypothetical protein
VVSQLFGGNVPDACGDSAEIISDPRPKLFKRTPRWNTPREYFSSRRNSVCPRRWVIRGTRSGLEPVRICINKKKCTSAIFIKTRRTSCDNKKEIQSGRGLFEKMKIPGFSVSGGRVFGMGPAGWYKWPKNLECSSLYWCKTPCSIPQLN